MPLLNKKEIGKRLEMCRVKLNVKPTEFAQRAGVDQSQYSKIEKGKLALSSNIWDKLYATYKLDKAFILLGINVPVANSTLQLPGPEASLKQLLIVQEELRQAGIEISDRIQKTIFPEKGNSENGISLDELRKDNKTKKRK